MKETFNRATNSLCKNRYTIRCFKYNLSNDCRQWDLLHVLEKELAEIGLEEITLDENGYLFATLPANTDKDLPTIGFLAHVDTATDYTGKNVNPQRIENYDGQDIP